MKAPLFNEPTAGQKQLSLACVSEVHADGTISVTSGENGSLCCEVLRTGDAQPLTLVEGDSVLVWERPEHSGVILGRIGHGHATQAQEIESQGGLLPDELVIEARKNLTFKCGQGSITIREDGKILIKGKDLVSHAQRMNRIKGGSVSIN